MTDPVSIFLRNLTIDKSDSIMNPIHLHGNAQHVNVRLYFDNEENMEPVMDKISEALSGIPKLISAYELVSDGFGKLVPDVRPIA